MNAKAEGGKLLGLEGRRQVIGGLHVDPELRGGAERAGEQPRRVGGHAPLAVDDLVDALDRDAEVLGELGLRDAHGLEELLGEDLAGVGG